MTKAFEPLSNWIAHETMILHRRREELVLSGVLLMGLLQAIPDIMAVAAAPLRMTMLLLRKIISTDTHI